MADGATEKDGAGAARPAEAPAGLLCIDDGYTLRGTLKDDDGAKPPVEVTYRPALPEDVIDYQMAAAKAGTGAEKLAAQVRLLDAHLVAWSGLARRDALGRTVPVEFVPGRPGKPGTFADPGVRRALGTDYLTQLLNLVAGYTPGRWEADAKNS